MPITESPLLMETQPKDDTLPAPKSRAFDVPTAPTPTTARATKIRVQNLSLFYTAKQALYDVTLDIPEKQVTAFIGPSGCGKSTLLRCFNRMNDLVGGVRITGQV